MRADVMKVVAIGALLAMPRLTAASDLVWQTIDTCRADVASGVGPAPYDWSLSSTDGLSNYSTTGILTLDCPVQWHTSEATTTAWYVTATVTDQDNTRDLSCYLDQVTAGGVEFIGPVAYTCATAGGCNAGARNLSFTGTSTLTLVPNSTQVVSALTVVCSLPVWNSAVPVSMFKSFNIFIP